MIDSFVIAKTPATFTTMAKGEARSLCGASGPPALVLEDYVRWKEYLDALGHDAASSAAIQRLAEVAQDFRAKKHPVLAPGITTPIDDGVVTVAWSYPKALFEIEVSGDGISWFFRDRERDESEGSDEPAAELPARAMDLLAEIAVWDMLPTIPVWDTATR
jgi:hypothetical protein